MSWHCSRALVEEFLAGIYSGGEPSAPLNTTPMPDQFYWPDKTTEHSRLSRFGTTCEPLTADRGAGLLTWFLEASRAKTSASQGAEMDSMASDRDYGQKCHASFVKFDRDSSTWRTAQCSLLGGLDEFSGTWPAWGSMQNGECWERTIPTLTTRGKESGFWPTMCARDYRGIGKSRLERTGSKAGECLPQAIGGLLNPTWGEWLMGWPIGWTELKPLETARFQEWRQQHGAFSQGDR